MIELSEFLANRSLCFHEVVEAGLFCKVMVGASVEMRRVEDVTFELLLSSTTDSHRQIHLAILE